MLRRIEPEDRNLPAPLQAGASSSEPIVPAVADGELETALSPHDRPRWIKDATAVSARAREIIAGMRPAVVRVLSFWDHRIRAIVIGDRLVQIDASGCYRAD